MSQSNPPIRSTKWVLTVSVLGSSLGFIDSSVVNIALPSSLAKRLGSVPSTLAELTLLTARSAPSLWDDWLVESGSPPVEVGVTRHFEDLVLALAAARSGSGFTIAPRASIEDDLKQGRLVAPFGFVRRTGGYSICYRDADARAKPFVTLRNWLSAAGLSS